MLPLYEEMSKENAEIWWDLISFDSNFLKVQIYFKKPHLTQVSLVESQYPFNLHVTFWNP